MAAAKIKMMELAKELGVTSKELMVAAEDMGHKGVRAMSPLDSTLANALRVKLGKGRELPEAPKPKRVPKPRVAKDAAAKVGDAPGNARTTLAKTAAEPSTDEAPAEVKPAATIVRPKPAAPVEIAPEPPLVPKREPEITPEPVPVAPDAEAPMKLAATVAPPPAPPPVKKPEPKIVPFRPIERQAAPPAPAR
ncbi:MAG: hypothetical protein ACREIY_02480, partial [Candidatus Rokuibacteriota bacterium]